MPTKVRMHCTNCGRRIKTAHPEIIMRRCKGCNQETEFERLEKKPVIDKHAPVDVICRRCCTPSRFPDGKIPSECPNCHLSHTKPHDETITDTILRILTRSNEKDKWYLKGTIGRDGSFWWKNEKDSFGDDVFPFIGDYGKTGHYSQQDQIDSMRTDDLRPVYTTTTKRRFIK